LGPGTDPCRRRWPVSSWDDHVPRRRQQTWLAAARSAERRAGSAAVRARTAAASGGIRRPWTPPDIGVSVHGPSSGLPLAPRVLGGYERLLLTVARRPTRCSRQPHRASGRGSSPDAAPKGRPSARSRSSTAQLTTDHREAVRRGPSGGGWRRWVAICGGSSSRSGP
jgi:hypothetical protein